MLAVVLGALCFLSGDTPEETFRELVKAVRDKDWGSIYDLSAPSEHAEMTRQINQMKKDPTGLSRLAGLMGESGDKIRSMSTRKIIITVMAKMAEVNKESFEKDLGRLRNAKITGRLIDGNSCTLQYSSEVGKDEVDLVREDGRWYYSTMIQSRRASNERNASATLRSLVTAQADFRYNDRDGDGVKNFWVKDVAGLYGIETRGHALKLIEPSAAAADRTEGRGAYKTVRDGGPKAGYHFVALKKYVDDGEGIAYDDGTGKNPLRFGFAAVPATYGQLSRTTFIIDVRNVAWSKNTGGKVPDRFPADPAKEGWTRIQ